MVVAESMAPVMIAAGGTGGHIYPALAVAAEMRRRGRTLLWLGNANGMEAQLSRRHQYKLLPIVALPLRGQGVVAKAKALLCVLWSVVMVLWYFLRYRPALVLSMGGYASAAGSVAAWLVRVPLCLHEQNAVPGLVNRKVAPLATVVMEAYKGSFPSQRQAVHTGNPVRPEIVAVAGRDQAHRPPCVLLLGGSQGAAVLNDVMPAAWQLIREGMQVQLWHQAGDRWFNQVRAVYKDDAMVQVSAHIDDMAGALAAADLVVCRGGAMTLAEIAAAGVPAVIVPYKFAADDHQNANAAYMVRLGAARLLLEQECSPQRLAQEVLQLLSAPQRLVSMAAASKAGASNNAIAEITDLCLGVARG